MQVKKFKLSRETNQFVLTDILNYMLQTARKFKKPHQKKMTMPDSEI